MSIILETDRLNLKRFTLADASFILELLNSPSWIKFIGDKNVRSLEDAASYLENGPIKSYADNGHGLCLVERKGDNMPVGMCGIVKRPQLVHPDIGFAFLPDFHSNGYAFEIAGATLTYARKTLGLNKVVAITRTDNLRSIGVLERCGLAYEKTFSFPESDEVLQLYS